MEILINFFTIINFFLILLFFRSAKIAAVIASVIAEIVISSLYLIHCDGYMSLKTLLRLSWKKVIAGGVMVAAVLVADPRIPSNVPGLIAVVAVGGCVYLAALLALRDSAMLYAVKEFTKRLHRGGKKTQSQE